MSDEQRPRVAAGSAHQPSPAVEIKDLTITFQQRAGQPGPDRRVVHGLDLVCASGEFVVLVGASGCGKTTVLNAIAGMVEPTAGEVKVLGTTPTKARGRLGYMLARDALLPWRTARKNVCLSMEIHGIPRSQRREAAERYLDLLRLGDAADRYVWQLSHGMRQRVALARTWASEPELILMDEPFSALDAQTREVVRDEFVHLWERDRRSVVFVTHDLTEALLLADRIVVLRDGRVHADKTIAYGRPRTAVDLEDLAEFREVRRELMNSLTDRSARSPVSGPR